MQTQQIHKPSETLGLSTQSTLLQHAVSRVTFSYISLYLIHTRRLYSFAIVESTALPLPHKDFSCSNTSNSTPAIPSLSLVETFNQDPRAEKVNLGIGIYFDNHGKLPLLDCVRSAEIERAATAQPRPYLPMEGLAAYRSAVQNLLFGQNHPALAEKRIATIQTLGGWARSKWAPIF